MLSSSSFSSCQAAVVSEKDLRAQRGNFLTKRLLPSTSKRMTDDDLSMVQKSVEARSQRSRRSGGITNKSDANQFLKESSRRYRPATRLTSVTSLESTASDQLAAADRAQATELPNVEQLTLTETQQQHVETQHELHPSDSVRPEPRRKRSSLLRRLSSTLKRDASTTRYDNFDGHRDSLEIIRRQIQTDGIAYRPRVPHPTLDGIDCDKEDNGCKEESPSTNIDNIAMNSSPAFRSNNVKQREEVEGHQDVVNTRSDRASQQNPSAVLPVHETSGDNRGHHKVSAENNTTPLPPQLHNEKVGYARSA